MTLLKRLLVSAALTLGASVSAVSAAEDVGILALYDRNEADAIEVLQEDGCRIQRKGALLARLGNLDLPEVDAYALLRCDRSVLREPARTLKDAGRAILLEGSFHQVEEAGQSGADREYLIKVSVFNNTDPVGRSKDLKALQASVAPLPDKYRVESSLDITWASGISTPDEVTVLYYESPASGNRFRENNPAVLEAVGRFNKTHLVSWVYLVATGK